MYSARWIIVIWFWALPINATAVLIQVAGTNASMPFNISKTSEPLEPLSLVMQIVNENENDLNIAIWQLDLELRRLPESVGQLVFTEVKAPPDGLFDPIPGPLGNLLDPSARILVFDGDLISPAGRSLQPGAARNIVELLLRADPGTRGEFQLIMHLLDPLSPTTGSSYLEAEQPIPAPFANATPAIGDGILLGSIVVPPVPEPCSELLLFMGALTWAPWYLVRRPRQRPPL